MSMNAALQVATIVMATARIRLEVLFANAQLDSRAMLLAQMDAYIGIIMGMSIPHQGIALYRPHPNIWHARNMFLKKKENQVFLRCVAPKLIVLQNSGILRLFYTKIFSYTKPT